MTNHRPSTEYRAIFLRIRQEVNRMLFVTGPSTSSVRSFTMKLNACRRIASIAAVLEYPGMKGIRIGRPRWDKPGCCGVSLGICDEYFGGCIGALPSFLLRLASLNWTSLAWWSCRWVTNDHLRERDHPLPFPSLFTYLFLFVPSQPVHLHTTGSITLFRWSIVAWWRSEECASNLSPHPSHSHIHSPRDHRRVGITTLNIQLYIIFKPFLVTIPI